MLVTSRPPSSVYSPGADPALLLAAPGAGRDPKAGLERRGDPPAQGGEPRASRRGQPAASPHLKSAASVLNLEARLLSWRLKTEQIIPPDF